MTEWFGIAYGNVLFRKKYGCIHNFEYWLHTIVYTLNNKGAYTKSSNSLQCFVQNKGFTMNGRNGLLDFSNINCFIKQIQEERDGEVINESIYQIKCLNSL